ncbi:Na+/H+ antiporter subunit E [Streptomyces sp. Tu 3180]|uniref:Na+/H+ antiporter subunit E n=1 Tax=Streptomyces sp. Tu 3180 TaxID=2682611 RepID=UPI001357B1FF|nr:Na+/H+ antiporter subunit E [Streptomyces sp. Tu 3180]KAF3468966.1 Na+/H+ antiporter subunit E [Streptomyces sp. Tu 3180]
MSRRERIRRALHHLPLVVWLWLLWVALWGSTGAVVLVGGLLVAVAVAVLFPLPSVLPGAVPRPRWIGLLLLHLLADLVRSGTIVAWEVVRHGGRTRSAVIEVPLHVDDDVLITAVAEITTIAPGTVVTEIDRRRRRLYVHALPVRDREAVARRKKETQELERRVARVVGHRHHPLEHGSPSDAPDGPPPSDPPPDDPPPDHRGRRR